MLEQELTTFNNGLKLISAPLANTKAVTVMFLVGVGSRYEKKDLNGISHFLEHMFFKGTGKRPTTLDISKELDAVGASYNAFTAEEYTGFFVRVESGHFELAMDILTDLLYNAKFDEKEVEKEKGVILEEINMYQDMPSSYVVDVAKELFYGDQPLGRPVTGLKETVKSIKRSDLVQYRDKFYSPDNLIVTIAGGKNSTDWIKKTQQYLDKIDLKKEGNYEKATEAQKEPQIKLVTKKTDQAHMIIGFRTIPRTDSQRPILKVLNNLLGETMSSRLFTEVREKRGLAYYISSEMADFIDAGALGVSAGVDIQRAEEAIKVILDEFNKLKTVSTKDDELKRAKENLKGRLYLSLEESFAVADFIAEQQLFWGYVEDPDDLVKDYQKVTANDIKNFAQKYFTKENLNLAMIAPFDNSAKFNEIMKGYK